MVRNPKAQGEEALGERAKAWGKGSPQQEQEATKSSKPNQCWQCEGVGHLKRDCPTLKGKGLFQGGMLKQP